MKVLKIIEIEYDDYIYTPEVEDNHNYLFENNILSKNCQNFSKSSLRTSISRLDKGCKLIVIGSNNQIDNPYINKYTNGLSVLFNATKEKHPEVKLHATTMDKIVRGGITAFAERVFNSK